ncbi:hypothetical protein Cs7R123_44760 [Catellatospora sp. TT07R-123]|uniref:hypothetical protein n=1 Tax=Catellatospora sp. TT07R-123 TaxID=2733863 RepID=UPI001B00D109|nr:hypothetical protein [Catellatospora sp. TT07R-123]GHJ47134.1 hypothetical protein Cs7R123_44760 [Catellatospora sp. TT07R-123]
MNQHEEYEVASAPGWAPVVFGRTRNADVWWRAVPAGVSHRDWLTTAVGAVVDGGHHLDRPRFLISRDSAGNMLVGVACRAAQLHPEMNSHENRPLHTFVGWVAPASTPDPPTLAELREHWQEWAGPVYTHWVGGDWDKHLSQLRDPHITAPEHAPWHDTRAGRLPERESTIDDDGQQLRLKVKDGTWLIPAAKAEHFWELAFTSYEPFAVVFGWQQQRQARRRGATHVVVDDVDRFAFEPSPTVSEADDRQRSSPQAPPGTPSGWTFSNESPTHPGSQQAPEQSPDLIDRLTGGARSARDFALGAVDGAFDRITGRNKPSSPQHGPYDDGRRDPLQPRTVDENYNMTGFKAGKSTGAAAVQPDPEPVQRPVPPPGPVVGRTGQASPDEVDYDKLFGDE